MGMKDGSVRAGSGGTPGSELPGVVDPKEQSMLQVLSCMLECSWSLSSCWRLMRGMRGSTGSAQCASR